MTLAPRTELSQGDLFAPYRVPRIDGVLDADLQALAIVLPHSCDLDKVDYVTCATAWRLSQLPEIGISEKGDLGNIVANRQLDMFALVDVPQVGEPIVVDLRHVSTWSKAVVAGWKKTASLTELETDAFQWALMRFYSLRDITRERVLTEFEGKTIRSIKVVAESKEQARVSISFDGSEDALNLWLHPRRK